MCAKSHRACTMSHVLLDARPELSSQDAVAVVSLIHAGLSRDEPGCGKLNRDDPHFEPSARS